MCTLQYMSCTKLEGCSSCTSTAASDVGSCRWYSVGICLSSAYEHLRTICLWQSWRQAVPMSDKLACESSLLQLEGTPAHSLLHVLVQTSCKHNPFLCFCAVEEVKTNTQVSRQQGSCSGTVRISEDNSSKYQNRTLRFVVQSK